MSAFKKIPADFLKSIATNSERIPTLYYSENSLVGYFFWLRLRFIYWLLGRYAPQSTNGMDFGGGGGVFLPTLSQCFTNVTLVDLETKEARQVIAQYGLLNIEVVQGDVAHIDFGTRTFDAIIAADVLEHFKDLSIPAQKIHAWLSGGGVLVTSLPTENFAYCFLRKIFKVEKPFDHYHTASQVEAYLQSHGFMTIRRLYSPLLLALFPLYSITAWRKV